MDNVHGDGSYGLTNMEINGKMFQGDDMSRHQRILSKTGYYHVMLRGNEKKNIFIDDEDKLRIIETIYQMKIDQRFYLQAFCVMDNHLHLMLCEGTESISKVMKRITVSYVHYFNDKYRRVGHLFQDRFKSEVVEEDGYVLSLARYIHQNPVKAGIIKFPRDYKWSSYNSYLEDKNYIGRSLDTEMILGMFAEKREIGREKFEIYMNEGSQHKFIDLDETDFVVEKEAAEIIFKELMIKHKIDINRTDGLKIPNNLVREFKSLTGLSNRKISSITGINKEKVNKIISGFIQ